MNERNSLESVLDPLIENNRSDFKLTREKRSFTDSGGKVELTRKRVKMRDLESVLRSEGIETHKSESVGCDRIKNHFHIGKNPESSQITEEPEAVISDAFQAVTTGQNILSHLGNTASMDHVDSDLSIMDINTKAHIVKDSVCDAHDKSDVSFVTKKDEDHWCNSVSSRGIELDLNADDSSNSAEQDLFYPYEGPGHVKSMEASECGSSTGPLEENDSFRVWNEMKRNGFLSCAHGGIPVPTQRGRKRKNDALKKKMEIAKREQVHRFTKIAAPSGLLNGLNPGIINHVRNSKQVHSIIKALVRSEKLENGIQSRSAGHSKGGIKDINEKGKNPEGIHILGACRLGVSFKDEQTNILSEIRQTKEHTMSSTIPYISLSSKHINGRSNSEIAERRFPDETSGASHLTSDHEEDMLALKLSSSRTMASGNISVSNEEGNQTSVSSLSVKAATVASQWLELLNQDIRGRLAALRRSKKRVQAVIQTELPFLMSKEFSSTQENDTCFRQSSSDRCPNAATPDMHRARWTALFDQMDKTLSDEGKHLESWLNQVKEMQLQCERGLQCVDWHSLQLLGRAETDPRSKKENVERELAVRAAAASIYSTCNFVTATEDVSCF